MINKHELEKFLGFTLGAKDISLIIARDKEQLSEYISEMGKSEFQKLPNFQEVIIFVQRGGRGYILIDALLEKEIYDFVVQYPTGQIEIWDRKKNDSIIIYPNYKTISLVLLVTNDVLSKNNEAGFVLLDKVGLTYRE